MAEKKTGCLKLSKLIEGLVIDWMEWNQSHSRAINSEVDINVRDISARRCEQIVNNRYNTINAIDLNMEAALHAK